MSIAPVDESGANTHHQRVLVVYVHPAEHQSVVNKTLTEKAHASGLVTLHSLYQSYPNFFIDVRHEQQLLLSHDVIIFQHPFYWYSVPALLKEWIDLVLEYGWAYGTGGNQLANKVWGHAISTGGKEQAYREQGQNRYTIDELLRPLQQTAHLCQVKWAKPFITYEGRAISEHALHTQSAQYIAWIQALQKNTP
jgi:glutathione-regulated potassium-efflux system ancillary protein KefG